MIYLQYPKALLLLLALVFAFSHPVSAQLDTIHWLPPAYARAGIGPQYIYLATPEEQAFTVTIRSGSGKVLGKPQISNAQPFRFDLGDTYSELIVADTSTGHALQGYGLVIDGPKKFYAAFRTHDVSAVNANHMLSKGRAALGKTFRIGHMRQVTDKTDGRSNFIGILATQDSTLVTVSGYNPSSAFVGGVNILPDGSLGVLLQKGESAVFAHDVGDIGEDIPPNGFMGALLNATRPVVVNCGSWMGAPVIYTANDIAMDQIVPLERIGKEYIVCRGTGPTSLEHPIVVAHSDNTKVWINDDPVPVDTLNAGAYFVIPTFYYSKDKNMYIRTSEPAYVFQMTGGILEGKHSLQSIGFMFIPPINCGIDHAVNNIMFPNKIGDAKFDGGLSIVALKDASVQVLINGQPVEIEPPAPVPGNVDFVTYRDMDVFIHTKASSLKTLQVISDGPIQVTLIEFEDDIGFSTFFSGYEEPKPVIHIAVQGDGICPDTLMASGYFDGVQWVYEDSVMQLGPSRQFIVAAPGLYKAVGYVGGCLHTATVADSLLVPLTEPKFPYSFVEPTCFGYADGQITFGTPIGGDPPYRYSIDFGQHFSDTGFFDQVPGGLHKLVVQDVSGCYNQPIKFILGQPDSFYVNIVPWHVPDPFVSGELAELEAWPSHPVETVIWQPADFTGCVNCLDYDIRPEATTWVVVQVQDGIGCRASDSLLLVVDPRIYLPTALKPDGLDGNDRLMIFSKEPLPVLRFLVFDRWGQQVFENTNFQTNDVHAGWDGRFRGKRVPEGVYVYIAEVEIEPGRVALLRGNVAVF